MKISKKTKKWLLVGVVALLAYWLYRRAYTVTASVGRVGIPIVQNIRNYDSKGRKYITLLSFPESDLDAYFTELANIGIDGVFQNVRYADIAKPNGTYDFSRYDAIFNVATANGIEVFPNLLFRMGVGEWSDFGFDPSNRWLNYDGSLYGAGSVSARYDAPIWKTHFEPFVTAFCDRYKPYYEKGWMPGVSFANTIQDEFNFSHDWEPLNVTTYKQKHELLQACFDGLTAAAGTIPTCFHSGDFQTDIALRVGTLGFRRLAARAGWVKQNPNKFMDIPHSGRLVASTGKGSIIELTYTEGLTEYELSAQAGIAYSMGVDIVTFAFLDGPAGLPKLRAIKEQMVQKGVWGATKGTLPSHVYTVNVSDMIANGGYNLTAFKAAYVDGIAPQVNQVYDL